ncbi:hypothetical protein Vretimale_12486 [Volvox reticuliferus]|uniref:Hydroxymethylglutaryl-CoA synthase n=1 Tax=Volvox reticuliferus TaxID=1737510 RepID=A0A8J4CDW4_9CHLO|nr:hypothetical protein Vretifemale_9033 [Volvox reticuliferus]GIM08478.1 hypothetical protein Vretimale_12486 [Volvox reticuliferus]
MPTTWIRYNESPRPEAVGILAIEVYFPTQHVLMSDQEAADGCPGKYTQGLGQEGMSFCNDREDVVSMALTVTHSLMEKYGIRTEEVGHVQVGTESGVDRSKSIKSHLMKLFAPQQQPGQQVNEQQGGGSCSSDGCQPQVTRGPPAEGTDCVHACYGGTAALLAAVAWVESRRWDGRLALVVAADVALYAPGTAARPTGGCGAAAILVGPDAPLVLDPLWYGNHSEHSWDFWKPFSTLPYPAVDGPRTLVQYLGAAGHCALRLADRLQAAGELAAGEGLLPQVHHYVAHAPFNKLAKKGLSRVALMDHLRGIAAGRGGDRAHQWRSTGELAEVDGEAAGVRRRSSQEQEEQQREGSAGKEVVSEQGQHSAWVREWIQEEDKNTDVTPQALPQGPGNAPAPTLAEVPDSAASRTAKDTPSSALINAARHQKPELSPEGPVAAATATATSANAHEVNMLNAAAQPMAGPRAAAANSRLEGLLRGMLEGVDIDALTVSSYDSPCATWRLDDKVLEAQLLACTAEEWLRKAEDGAWLQKQVGNSYTACVWQGLASLVWRRGTRLAGQRVLLFSFGSGTIASLLSLVPRGGGASGGGTFAASEAASFPEGQSVQAEPGGRSCVDGTRVAVAVGGEGKCGQGGGGGGGGNGPSDLRFTLEAMQRALNLESRLQARVRRTVEAFDAVSAQVAASYVCAVPYEPGGDLADVARGSYYLARVDEHGRRWYERKA